MRLRGKVLGLFLLNSLLVISIVVSITFYHTYDAKKNITQEIQTALFKDTQRFMLEKAKDIAKLFQFYIELKKQQEPNFKWDDLAFDPLMASIGIQTIGKTGYSALIMKKGKTYITFLHPNPKLIGVKLNKFAQKYPNFWRIIQGPRPGQKFVDGFYKWPEPGKGVVQKYMMVIRVPNTPFLVATTIHASEIEEPLKKLENRLAKVRQRFIYLIVGSGVFSIIISIVLAVYLSSYLVKPIKHLAEVAEKISLGDLRAPINYVSSDELGDLADALRRMQASLVKAIRRLQQRIKQRR